MLDDGDKAMCAEIAANVCEKILITHIKGCPIGIKMGKLWMLLLGASIGGATGGGGIVAVIMHIMGG